MTAMDDDMGAMSTSMSPLDSETAGGTHVGKFRIPSKAPLTFAYALHVRRGDVARDETREGAGEVVPVVAGLELDRVERFLELHGRLEVEAVGELEARLPARSSGSLRCQG